MRGARSNFLVIGVVLLLCFMPVVSAGLFDWFTGTGKVVDEGECTVTQSFKNAGVYSCKKGQALGSTGIIVKSLEEHSINLDKNGAFSLSDPADSLLRKGIEYELFDDYLVYYGEGSSLELAEIIVIENRDFVDMSQGEFGVYIVSTNDEYVFSLDNDKLIVRTSEFGSEELALGEKKEISFSDMPFDFSNTLTEVEFMMKFGSDFAMVVVSEMDSVQEKEECKITQSFKNAGVYSCKKGQALGSTGIIVKSLEEHSINLDKNGAFSLSDPADSLLRKGIEYELFDDYLVYYGEGSSLELAEIIVIENRDFVDMSQGEFGVYIVSTNDEYVFSLDNDKLIVRTSEFGSEELALGEKKEISFSDMPFDFSNTLTEVEFMMKFGSDFAMVVVSEMDSVQNKGTNDGTSSKDVYCNGGCTLNHECIPIGYRDNGKYCSVVGFDNQKNAEETCDNNFECKSNLCIDSACVEAGLWKKIMNWFSRIF